jgi:hypothetical protein
MGIEAAAALDRLPWLSDDPQPKPAKHRGRAAWIWATAAVVAVAGAGFWMGTNSIDQPSAPQPARVQPTTTIVRLPEARPAGPAQLEVKPMTLPEVQPVAAPPMPEIAEPPVVKHAMPAPAVELHEAPATPVSTEASGPSNQSVVSAPVVVTAVSPSQPLTPWPPRVVAGAAGRLVQVGAFGSVPQAKLGWHYMVRAYPAMTHLPAVVRPDRNSKGRVFYRFRIGTTSQAHSEVLCQRMEKIRLSCAVIGLPWKAKVER